MVVVDDMEGILDSGTAVEVVVAVDIQDSGMVGGAFEGD